MCVFRLPYSQNARTSHRLLRLAKQLCYRLLQRLAGSPDKIHWIDSYFRNNCTSHKLAFASSYIKMILACFRLAGIDKLYIIADAHMSIFLFVFNYLTIFVGKVLLNNIIYFQEFFTLKEMIHFSIKEQCKNENDSKCRNVTIWMNGKLFIKIFDSHL